MRSPTSVPSAASCKLFIFLVYFVVSQALAQPTKYPAPNSLGDPATLGQGIQRTMTLLATSTPTHRNTVKILFYGQSITEQAWAKTVADDLKRRFPNANLIIENRALGGFASQLLVKSAETDLYPFYPDLLIFYVYGSHVEYENIIRRTRERTTAEILIQTDHLTADDQQTEETDPAKIFPKTWNSFMNYKFLPETAKKYNCGLVDQRNLWKKYLKDNNLSAKQLLRDGVHLNDHGCYLMAELVKAYLIKRNDPAIDPLNCDIVKTYIVGKDINWQNGKLTLPFEGNRVDLVGKDRPSIRSPRPVGRGEGQGEGALQEPQAVPTPILVDGKKPSQIPELYGFTRALPLNDAGRPRGKWPVIMNLRSESPLQLEDWTMQVTKGADKIYSFTLAGSKTGPDGQGRSDQPFTSNSRRVLLATNDWHVEFSLGTLAGAKPIPDKFTVKWQVDSYFIDEFNPEGRRPASDSSIEPAVTIAEGLKNTSHTLEITGNPTTPISAIRIYRPPQ